MTMVTIIKVGVFLENNVLPHSKPTKQGHQGSLSGIETVYKELQFLLPFSADPATVTELPQTPFQSVEPKIFIFIKSKAKQTNQELPTISTILTEEKNQLSGLPSPSHFLSWFLC